MAKLVSSNFDDIIEAYNSFEHVNEMIFPKIFGDGKASKFICEIIFSNFK